MDEQVKARLIGATVLVAIAVLLVPELLSGPKRDHSSPAVGEGKRGTRTYTIDLGGAVASGARLAPASPPAAAPAQEATRLPAVAEAPGSAAESAAVVADDPPAPPVDQRPPSAAAPGQAVGVDAAPEGGWSVQVGAFGSADSARRLVADLKKNGLPAYVAPLTRDGKTLHRVRVGPEPTREAAGTVAATLKGRGLPATVVAAD